MGRAGTPVGNGDRRRQPLDGRELGTVAHVAIGELLAAGVRRPTADEIMKLVGRHRLLRTVTQYRQAAKQKLVGAVAVYFRLFALAEEWRFVGAELPVRGSRFDLVFEGTDDRVLVDELKTGRIQTVEERRAAEEQLRRHIGAGVEEYGGRFAGVRQLWLGAPARSVWAKPDGSSEALTWPGGR
jgi:hypothetical protein